MHISSSSVPLRRRPPSPIGPWLIALAACGGCSAASSEGAGDGAGASSGTGGALFGEGGSGAGNVPGGAGSTPGAGASLGDPSAAGGLSGDEACVAETRAGEELPLDMFVIWDRSGSMDDEVTGGTKWTLVTGAFESFVNDPESAGISVGIGYFPLFNGDGGGRRGDSNTVCDIAAYAQAAVPIAPLPGNAAAVTQSLGAEETDGRTPTRVALAGAIDYARQWANTHTDRKVVVVLQTDGEPNVCESTVEAVADVAAAGLAGTPSLPTYVIGVGEELGNLHEIAQAGGTGSAFIVDTTADTAQQFIDAMNEIRATASAPCEFVLPTDGSAGMLDYGKVNVTVALGGGAAPVALYQVPGGAACDPVEGGWYYDNPQAPGRIELCSTTCDVVVSSPDAQVNFELGCATRPIVIR